MSLKISIPKPCSENWNQMTPTQKGAFCQSCSKEVLDFTNTSKTELARKLDTDQNICGRFKPEQLNTPLPSITRSNFKRNAALLGFTSVLAMAIPTVATAQSVKKTPAHQVETDFVLGRIAPRPTQNDTITIKGFISNGEQPLAGASVVLEGTNISVRANHDGQYELSIPRAILKEHHNLVFSTLGFTTTVHTVNTGTTLLNVTLKEDMHIMGEVMILEKPTTFKRIGNLFRKN